MHVSKSNQDGIATQQLFRKRSHPTHSLGDLLARVVVKAYESDWSLATELLRMPFWFDFDKCRRKNGLLLQSFSVFRRPSMTYLQATIHTSHCVINTSSKSLCYYQYVVWTTPKIWESVEQNTLWRSTSWPFFHHHKWKRKKAVWERDYFLVIAIVIQLYTRPSILWHY